MKITRALLLSSRNQAESWERTQSTSFLGFSFSKTIYRYLATDKRHYKDGLRFQVFCVHQEKSEDGTSRNVVASTAHVDESFEDMGVLINFLNRYQIDYKDNWQPVEEERQK